MNDIFKWSLCSTVHNISVVSPSVQVLVIRTSQGIIIQNKIKMALINSIHACAYACVSSLLMRQTII